jgi:hypothetical protein
MLKQRNVNITPTISFTFANNTNNNDTIQTHALRLKSKLSRKQGWNGKVACARTFDRYTLDIYNIFTGIKHSTYTFPHTIKSVVQHNKYLLVVTDTTVFVLDLITNSQKLIRGDEEEDVSLCVSLCNDRVLMHHDFFDGFILGQDLTKRIPIKGQALVRSVVELQNGNIAIRTSELFDDQDTIYVLDSKFDKRLVTFEPKNMYGSLIEIYPNVICFAGDGFHTFDTISRKSERYEGFSGGYFHMTKIRDGMFIVYSNEKHVLLIYENFKLLETIPVQSVNKLSLVDSNVVLWQWGKFVTLYDVNRRTEIGTYDCKDYYLCIVNEW